MWMGWKALVYGTGNAPLSQMQGNKGKKAQGIK